MASLIDLKLPFIFIHGLHVFSHMQVIGFDALIYFKIFLFRLKMNLKIFPN